jgi:hypothetical protein
MKLYRFSSIQTKEELLKAIKHVHFACHQLCKQTLGEYLPVAGNVGVFCHYDDEFGRLIRMRDELADVNDNWNQKYYRLHEPIIIPAKGDIPEATYTHLYIRRADPYRAQVGDADFVLKPEKFAPLKQSLLDGVELKGARAFDRPELDMIELHDPDVDALAYVHTHTMEDNMKIQREQIS